MFIKYEAEVVHVSSGTWVGSTSMLERQGVLISTFVHVETMQQRHLLRIIVSSFGNKMHYGVQPKHLHYTDVMLCHVQVSLGLGQGWQVFATWRKKNGFFFMEKTVLAKIVFASGKNQFLLVTGKNLYFN